MAAACCAAENGLRVIILDNNRVLGGQIWRGHGAWLDQSAHDPVPDAMQWIARVHHAGVSIIAGAQVFNAHPARDTTDMAGVQAETAAGMCMVKCRNLILATGARERFLPFPGWTLPGVYGAGGLQALRAFALHQSAVACGAAGSG